MRKCWCCLSRVTNRTKEIYYKELAHAVWCPASLKIHAVNQQAGDSGELIVCFGVKVCRLKTQGELRFQLESEQEKRLMSQFESCQTGRTYSYS